MLDSHPFRNAAALVCGLAVAILLIWFVQKGQPPELEAVYFVTGPVDAQVTIFYHEPMELPGERNHTTLSAVPWSRTVRYTANAPLSITVKGAQPTDKVRCAIQLDGETAPSSIQEAAGEAHCEMFGK
jgi:hypothetical protein